MHFHWKRSACLALLWPVLWLEARYMWRVTPRMPEARGPRSGSSGAGPTLRVLIAGDSGAAGVGVQTQDDALCGHLVQCLGREFCVEWELLAVNGLDSPGLVQLLESHPAQSFDAVVLSIGANDATRLCTPQHWLHWQNQLAQVIAQRFAPCVMVHSAVPPMHACQALPQPLRWFMGRWAAAMNRALAQCLVGDATRSLHAHPESTTSQGMASDGIHPDENGYRLWAQGLGDHLVARHKEALSTAPVRLNP